MTPIARLLIAAALALPAVVAAQDIEPRAFSNAPVGVNFLLAGYVYTRGGLAFDPSVPITDAKLSTSSAAVAYARALDVFGMSGKFDVVLPYTSVRRQSLVAETLADALLAVEPQIASMAERAAWTLGRKHRWIRPFCTRLFHRFGSSLAEVDRRALIAWIREDEGYRRAPTCARCTSTTGSMGSPAAWAGATRATRTTSRSPAEKTCGARCRSCPC